MRTDRLGVLLALETQGVVPVFSHPDPETVLEVVRACVRGGAPCVEFTNRGDFMFQVFQEVSRELGRAGDKALLGVGSILDAPTAALYISAGARFVVGPVLDPDTARLCNKRMVAYSPGCGSATEIMQAQELGADIVKVFPGESVGGPAFVKAVLGPMPWTRIMPTGGVEPTRESLTEWFGAGIVACGIGSKLITAQRLKDRDWGGIEQAVRETVAAIADIRKGQGQ